MVRGQRKPDWRYTAYMPARKRRPNMGDSSARIKEPPVVFSPWVPWAERNSIDNAHLPGLYLLAHWDEPPPRIADPLAREVINIGGTTEGSLMGRWYQFHRSAFQGKPGHKDGMRYHQIFGDDPQAERRLYVAAFVPEGLPRELRALFIRYTTARLLWESARRWGAPPVCNAQQ